MSRIEYLKQKRIEYLNRINFEKKENALNVFLQKINSFDSELVRIISLEIDIENIAKPTLYNKPKKPIYIDLRYKTINEQSNVKCKIKNWILDQKTKTVLIKNDLLIGETDWLELNVEALIKNFDLLFYELNILYTLIFASEKASFINLFEFEDNVTIYTGKIDGENIKYYRM